MLKQTIADRREVECQKLALDRERLEMEKQCEKEGKERADRALDLEAKKLDIGRTRMELDRQKLMAELAKRKAGVEERESIVALISALAKKLS